MPNPKPEIAGKILNRNEMSAALGISSMTLQRFVGAGCPCIDKGSVGRPAKFNELEVRRWVEERKSQKSRSSDDDAKRRYAMAQAELKELALAERRGELVPISAVTATLRDELTAVRGRLLAMPGRLAHSLVGMTDAGQIEAAIHDEVIGALSELSQG